MGNLDSKQQEHQKASPLDNQTVQLPRGHAAVGIPYQELVKLQWQQIREWKPQSDVWWLKRGTFLIGSITAISSVIINFYFRRQFNLQGFNKGLTYIPGVLLPTTFSLIISEEIKKRVILSPDCQQCLEVRSGIFQMLSSVIYTAVNATHTSLFISRKNKTYLMGNKTFKPTISHALKTLNFSRSVFLLLVFVNFGAGSLVTYMQGQEIDVVIIKEAAADKRKRDIA